MAGSEVRVMEGRYERAEAALDYTPARNLDEILDVLSVDAREPLACAECGHLHFLGTKLGYEPCPICDCEGQEWAKELGG